MKKRTSTISLLLVTIILAMAAITQAEPLYNAGTMYQTYVCDPGRHLGTTAAGVDLRKGSGGDHDISGWLILGVWPTNDATITLNGESGKVIPVYGGMLNIVPISGNVTRMVISGEAIVCGM